MTKVTADDPRTLRKRIADLERELKSKPAPAAAVDSQAIERAVAAAVLDVPTWAAKAVETILQALSDPRVASDQDAAGVAISMSRCVKALRILKAIERLREDEGSSVEILCSNPEPPPNQAVVVTAWWTDWQPRRFEGDTLELCLAAAVKAMGEAVVIPAATEGGGHVPR